MKIFVKPEPFRFLLVRRKIKFKDLGISHSVRKAIDQNSPINDESLIKIEKNCDILRDVDFPCYAITEENVTKEIVNFETNCTEKVDSKGESEEEKLWLLTKLDPEIFSKITNSGKEIKWASNVAPDDLKNKLDNTSKYVNLKEVLERITEIHEDTNNYNIPGISEEKPKNFLDAIEYTSPQKNNLELNNLWEIIENNGYEVKYSYAKHYEKKELSDFWVEKCDYDFGAKLKVKYKTIIENRKKHKPNNEALDQLLYKEETKSKTALLTSTIDYSQNPKWIDGLCNYIQGNDILNDNYGIEIDEDLNRKITKSPDVYIGKDLFLIYFTYKNKIEHDGVFSFDYPNPPRFQDNAFLKINRRSRFSRVKVGYSNCVTIPGSKPLFDEYEKNLKFHTINKEKDINKDFLKKFRKYTSQILYKNESLKYFMESTGYDEIANARREHNLIAFYWRLPDLRRSIATSLFSLYLLNEILSKDKSFFKFWLEPKKNQKAADEDAKKLFMDTLRLFNIL